MRADNQYPCKFVRVLITLGLYMVAKQHSFHPLWLEKLAIAYTETTDESRAFQVPAPVLIP